MRSEIGARQRGIKRLASHRPAASRAIGSRSLGWPDESLPFGVARERHLSDRSAARALPLSPCARLDQYDSGLTRASAISAAAALDLEKEVAGSARSPLYPVQSPHIAGALRRNNRGIPRATSTRDTRRGAPLQMAKEREAHFQTQQPRSARRPRSRGERICWVLPALSTYLLP